MLFIGFFALSNAASEVETTALNSSNASANAYNATTGIVDGLGQVAGPAIVWMGVAAVVLVALGFLVVASNSGR